MWQALVDNASLRVNVLTAKLAGMLALGAASGAASVAMSQQWALAVFAPSVLAAVWGLRPRKMGAFLLPSSYRMKPNVIRQEYDQFAKVSDTTVRAAMLWFQISYYSWIVAAGAVALIWACVHYHEHLVSLWGSR